MCELITVTLNRRAKALVKEVIEYKVDKSEFDALIDTGLSMDDALEVIRANGNATVDNIDVDVIEIVDVHESKVTK